jgi:rare lipoprotein A
MAASTEFSRGAKVKVTNLDNNKSVIVTIKDWGPDPIKHPDRVIDLNKIAFQKIASTRAGIINVKVEPVIESTSTVAIKI